MKIIKSRYGDININYTEEKSLYALELVDANGKKSSPSFHLLKTREARTYGQFLSNATWMVVRMTSPESILDDISCLYCVYIAPNIIGIGNQPFSY